MRCRRCARTQPPAALGGYSCVYCGAPLPVRRWIAHPPPGVPVSRRVRLLRRPYAGPPRYAHGHPAWGFPPVAWRHGTVTVGESQAAMPVRGLSTIAVLSAWTALACLVAAVAEGWRFALLLAGRTRVLAGGPVHASDVTVLVAGIAALALGAVTAVTALVVLPELHRAAAVRAGRRPARSAASLVARLVVPGLNVYGAGQVLMEIARSLRVADRRDRGVRVIVPLWWLAWAVNGALVLATLIMAFWRSTQAMADTVQMHIAVDLVAAVVAGMFAAVTVMFRRAWSGRRSGRYAGWAVRSPESTARNRRPDAGDAVPDADGDAGDGDDAGVGEGSDAGSGDGGRADGDAGDGGDVDPSDAEVDATPRS